MNIETIRIKRLNLGKRISEYIVEALKTIWSFIYIYWILIGVLIINAYLFYLFAQTFNYVYPMLGLIILALGSKVFGGQGRTL